MIFSDYGRHFPAALLGLLIWLPVPELSCPVITDRECLTYLSEELGNSHSLLGNMSIDVEYDLRPFYSTVPQTAQGFLFAPDWSVSWQFNMGSPPTNTSENWRNTLLHFGDRCHFSVHFMRAFTEEHSEYLSLLDLEVKRSLEILKANSLFEDTAFVLLSGRGP
ncbi:hypothetical protein COOONC_24380 [Cooperia oncophora]